MEDQHRETSIITRQFQSFQSPQPELTIATLTMINFWNFHRWWTMADVRDILRAIQDTEPAVCSA